MLNDPYAGGTHLPDITVITPVFDAQGREVLFYTGSRGHHADVGGITPGSMPPDSRHIDDEGVLISGFLLARDGRLREAETRALFAAAKHPARNIDQNIADLRAHDRRQPQGRSTELQRMTAEYGLDVVAAYMRHVQDNAEEAVRRVIDRLRDGRFSYEMDHGAVIRVAIRVDRRAARPKSTSPAPRRRARQLQRAFRGDHGGGALRIPHAGRRRHPAQCRLPEAADLIVPEGSCSIPRHPAAVVAGNVETSQCVVDALYGALGVMGAAQGTMNNFTFGNERHQYYETICRRVPARERRAFDGTACVQTHMTNSRLTDPEVLEWRFPGAPGGASRSAAVAAARTLARRRRRVIRKIRFLETMTAAILSGHRRVPPYGLHGGQPGQVGRNAVERRDGRIEELPGTAQVAMQTGDAFVIETPGGGGWGHEGEAQFVNPVRRERRS
jgi:5-oxoprolinase (ATP-hydrolysing)